MYTTLYESTKAPSSTFFALLLKLCVVGLFLLGIAYLAVGYHGQRAPNYTGDFEIRWRERNYMANGVNPYDVSVLIWGNVANERELQRIEKHHLKAEASMSPSGYPPWGLAATFIFVLPGPYQFALHVFYLLSLASLAYTAWCAYQLGKQWGHWPAMLLAAGVVGLYSNAIAFKLGQYGFVLNAVLFFALRAHIAGKQTQSGLAMAIASIKPNYTFSQFILMLTRKQWKALGIVSLACALLSLVPWALTGVNPFELLFQMLRQSKGVSDGDVSLLNVARIAVPYAAAATVLAVACIAATAWAGWKYRFASPLIATSVAAVAARICLYHRQYDNQMLIFPLIALGVLALSTRQRWAWGLFFLFGLTLWLPLLYWIYTPFMIVFLSAIWVTCAAVLCANSKHVKFSFK